MRSETGAGTPLVIAIVGGLVMLTSLTLPLYFALSVRQSAAGAADAAALAAADTASGLLPGYACESAGRVAVANGFSLDGCSVDGLVATVRVSTQVLGVGVSAAASAGPPGG
ncbi:MAG: Rv3654c family TadE-like protein [Rhodoglobus sp.]